MPDQANTTPQPLSGTTTVDDKMLFDVERLTYLSAKEIAIRVAALVGKSTKDKVVVIAGTQLLRDLANLQAAYVSLDTFKKEYEALVPRARELLETHKEKFRSRLDAATLGITGALETAAVAAVSPASAVVATTLGLVSLFRQDVEYHGQQTTVDQVAFELAVAATVRTRGAKKVYVPDLAFVASPKTDPGSFQAKLSEVEDAKAKAWALVGPVVSQLAFLEAELDGAIRAKDQKKVDGISAALSDVRQAMEPVATPFGRTDQRYAEFQSQLNQIDQATGLSLLARIIRAESTRALC